MAPELFLSKPFGNGVDVFAFGVLLNEIWAREVPWDGFKPLDIKDRVRLPPRPSTLILHTTTPHPQLSHSRVRAPLFV